MKRLIVFVIVAGLIEVSGSSAFAQSTTPNSANPQGQLGFLQSNGAFVPVTARTSAQEAAAAVLKPTVYKGVFDVTLTIMIVSSIPTTNKISCGSVSLNVYGYDSTSGYQDSFYETVSGGTTTRTGNQAVCKFAIPYLWTLYIPGDDRVTVSFQNASAEDINGHFIYVNGSSGPSSSGMPVPKNGATTNLTGSLGL